MNIAFVLPYMEPGGVETVVLRLGKYFVERGNVVSVIATDREGEGWGSVRENGLRGACLACTDSFSQVAHAVKVGKYLADGFFDVVFLNHAPYAQAALRMLPDNVMVIPILHGDYEGAYRVGLRNAEAWNVAIGVSPKVCNVARGLMGNKPIVEICNGVDVPANEMWSRRTALKDHVKLLFVGHLQHSPKGVLFLPEILKGCLARGIDASLTIVGGGPDSERLVESVNESGLEGKVEFRGTMSPDSVYEVMITHEILLMPSFYEGLGLVSLEAQACGCVPIASRLPGATDKAIQEGQTGFLVPVGDVDQFVAAIERLCRDHDLWLDMSKKGRARIEKEFSVGGMGSAYSQVIEDCLRGFYPLPRNGRKGLWWDRSFFTWKDYVPDELRKLKKKFLRHW